MGRQTFQILGAFILLAGLVAGSMAAYRIATSLPISEEQGLAEAERASLPEMGATATQRGESLRGNVEFQVRKTALEAANETRKEKRSEGTVLLVSGIIAVIWGMAMLYTARSTPDADGR